MLTKLLAISPRTSVPDLSFDILEANSDAIQLRNIAGLGPVNADINSTPFGSIDGEAYNGSVVNKRNIVLTFGLNPSWVNQTMAMLRQSLYKYFMPKLPVRLRFFNDHLPEVQISGYVETFEPNIFSRDPEIQVSILCLLPDFIAVQPTIVNGVSSGELIEIDYNGTVDTGIVFRIGPDEAFIGDLILSNDAEDVQGFYAPVILASTDYLELSSVAGQKYFRSVSPDDEISNLLKTRGTPDDWIQLNQGENQISVMTTPLGIPWSITYYERFGGL